MFFINDGPQTTVFTNLAILFCILTSTSEATSHGTPRIADNSDGLGIARTDLPRAFRESMILPRV